MSVVIIIIFFPSDPFFGEVADKEEIVFYYPRLWTRLANTEESIAIYHLPDIRFANVQSFLQKAGASSGSLFAVKF